MELGHQNWHSDSASQSWPSETTDHGEHHLGLGHSDMTIEAQSVGSVIWDLRHKNSHLLTSLFEDPATSYLKKRVTKPNKA